MRKPARLFLTRSSILFLALLSAVSASAANVEVSSVLGEVELPLDLVDEKIPLGGLSGLTYDPACDLFFAVSDDRGHVAPPRIYSFRLGVDDQDVRPFEVITLRDEAGEPFARGLLDSEAVTLAPNGVLWVATEGEAHRMVPPRILGFRLDGTLQTELEIPPAFLPGEGRGVRSNHGFEGLSVSPDGARIVAAVESALLQDGPNADLEHGTVVRFVVFDSESRRSIAERAYRVEPVPDAPRPSNAYHSIGVSEILVLDDHRMLVVERSFSAGFGNRIRLFLADLRTGDDITGLAALAADVEPMTKVLVADLADLGIDPDNLEGLALGPATADGRPTLVMVADNNFHPDEQANQLLVLAVSGIEAGPKQRPAASVNSIQAAAHVSPLVGRCVSGVEGTVTAILGQKRGQAFWIQQTPGDDDPATSEGLFVMALDGLAEISVGDRLALSGRVEEPVWRTELPVTRLVADGLEVVDRGRDLPPPVVLGENGRPIPTPNIDDDGLTLFEPETDAIDFYESLEGMLVRLDDAVVVGPTSGYGEITVLGDAGAGVRPRSDRGGVVIQPENDHPERVIIDDRLVSDAPAVAVGDRLSGEIEGVLHYSYGSYKLLNPAPLAVVPAPTAAPAATRLLADDEHVTIATFNVENLAFAAVDEKVAALAETVVRGLGSPTVIALQEIQDDSGPEDDGVVSAEATLNRLVEAISSAGGPRYEWTQIDPSNNADGGRPGANIRVAVLFDAKRVAMVAAADSQLSTNPTALGSADAAFTDSRKPLVVELEIDGERLTVIVCHLRSKGGDDALFGRRQPPVRSSETQRQLQAELIRAFVDLRLSLHPLQRIVVLGDLNDFEFRGPIEIL